MLHDAADLLMFNRQHDTVTEDMKLLVPHVDGESLADLQTDGWTGIPAKIMLGDGISWMALVSFPIERIDGQDIISIYPPQEGLFQLFEELPPVTGVGIRGDTKLIETTFTHLYRKVLVMKDVIEWLFFNPRSAEGFFEALRDDTKFAKTYRSYYEPARAMLYCLLNEYPSDVPICEENTRTNQLQALDWACRYRIWLERQRGVRKRGGDESAFFSGPQGKTEGGEGECPPLSPC